MNETLTLEIFEEMLAKFKPCKPEVDIIILTRHEKNLIVELCDLDTPKDNYYDPNRMMGIPVETFETKWGVLERAEELIREGKKVVVIK